MDALYVGLYGWLFWRQARQKGPMTLAALRV